MADKEEEGPHDDDGVVNGWRKGARPKVKQSQNGIIVPSTSNNVNGSKVNGLNGRSSASESDDDECCIYTYKGDRGCADLPSSFYQLDFVEGEQRRVPEHSNSSAANAVFSPDMDFLEMDFDPSATGEPDSDSASDENIIDIQEPVLPPVKKPEEQPVLVTPLELKPTNPAGSLSAPELSPNLSVGTSDLVHSLSSNSQLANNGIPAPAVAISSWPVKDEKTFKSESCGNVNNDIKVLRDDLFQSLKKIECKPLIKGKTSINAATVHPYNCSGSSLSSSCIERVMIWTEIEACEQQVNQLGTSACGATAVVNILRAMHWSCSASDVQDHIKTRLRLESSPVPEYLFSRSIAGVNHVDLIEGTQELTKGAIVGKFFHMYPKRNVDISQWLEHWMRKGAIPVATLNPQRLLSSRSVLPDAWHHQMIFGVDQQGIYLTNPLEKVTPAVLNTQLCSPSILMIRRMDVVNRWNESCDLTPLTKHEDQRWKDINVLGQVVNMLREELAPEVPCPFLTEHISIPACYKSGITLFLRKDSPAYQEFIQEPQMPLSNVGGATNGFV